jgi:uncharacterized protein
MSCRLFIAAKAPRIGEAKTRLGNVLGGAAAISLYRAFLGDIGERFRAAPFPVGWYVTPLDAWDDLRLIVGDTTGEQVVLVQSAGDWTERQRHLFRGAAERREKRTIIIASDSPHITIDTIVDAFCALEHHDVVLGPVYDGGYYLLGMRGWHDVLDGVPMSTSSVVEQITRRADDLGLRVGFVEATFDVDEAADLAHLVQLAQVRADLPATRAALEQLGLMEPLAHHAPHETAS